MQIYEINQNSLSNSNNFNNGYTQDNNKENFNLFLTTASQIHIYLIDNNKVSSLSTIDTNQSIQNLNDNSKEGSLLNITCLYLIYYDYIKEHDDIKITDLLNPFPDLDCLCITGHKDGKICLWSAEGFLSKFLFNYVHIY